MAMFMPFSPKPYADKLVARADAHTAAANGCLLPPCGPCGPLQRPYPDGTPSSAKGPGYGPISRGLTPPMSLGPYYDPRTTTIRAPVEASASGELITAPSMRHGPSAFFPDVGPPREKTQFAPHGTIGLDPIPLDLYLGPCVCTDACRLINPYSVAALMLAPQYALLVRDRLEDAGVVTVSCVLEGAPLEAMCACRVLGGPDHFSGYLGFVNQFADTSTAQIMEPAKVAADAADQYADQVLGNIRESVLGRARMNYLRAEGPRAYLSPRPDYFPDADPEAAGYGPPCYPTVLPGTGVRVSREDTAFSLRAMTDPRASAANRAALSCQTGLDIGGGPRCVAPPTPAMYSGQNACAAGPGWCGGAVPSPRSSHPPTTASNGLFPL